METWRMKQTQNQKRLFTIIVRGFVIPVQEKFFKWQYITFLRAYLVTILKVLNFIKSTEFDKNLQ